MNIPHATESFRRLNPHIFGRQEGKNDSSAIVERKRGIPDKMNDTEKKFALRLEGMKRDGEIEGWMYESIRLRLADRTTYTPDFFIWAYDDPSAYGGALAVTFIEIKGFRRDDAIVKFKVARELYPWAAFEMWELKTSGWNKIF